MRSRRHSSLLVAARALQGIGGAVISPASLAIIATSFAEGRERNKALGVWGAMGGVGGSLGALLGGVLTQSLGWPAIFIVNVPIGLAVLALGPRLIPEGAARSITNTSTCSARASSRARSRRSSTGSCARTRSAGARRACSIPLAAGLTMLGGFVFVEGRVALAPLVPLSIFRRKRLRAANIVMFLLYSGVFAMWFFLSLYLQQVLHYDALKAGLSFVPMTLSVVLGTTLAPRLAARLGEGRVLALGMLLAGAGLLLLTGVRPGEGYVGDVLPGGVLSALGLGLSLVPATIAAVSGVPADESGLASGLLNSSRLIGGALGLAVLEHDCRVAHALGPRARALRACRR